VTTLSLHKKLTSEDTNAVIYIYADWCESCELIGEEIKNLKKRIENKVNLLLLNSEDIEVEMYMEAQKIDGVPYFGVILGGDLISGHRGVIRVDGDNGEEFIRDFEDYINIVFS
jgi:thiol-disulfide isomerase/thioredoxin